MMKRCLVYSFFMPMVCFAAVAVQADEPPTVSAAEQAAQAQMEAARRTSLTQLCNHSMVYGSVEDKAQWLELIGDATCEDGIATIDLTLTSDE